MLFRKTIGAIGVIALAGLGVTSFAASALADSGPGQPAVSEGLVALDTPTQTATPIEGVIGDPQPIGEVTQEPLPVDHKDWVCKYVGTPGVNEILKNGNDGLVWVDSHATQGTWFNDAQGRSYVLLANAPHEPKPDASGCPAPQGPPPSITVTVTSSSVCADGKHVTTWSGTVSGAPSTYIAERVKYTSVTPPVLVGDFAADAPFTYVTTVDGNVVSDTAKFHVHVTQTAAGVDSLDADATGTVTFDGNCQPPRTVPGPQVCSPSGAWYTEDVAPTMTPDGWKFTGTGGAAVNWLHPTSGNFQGFTGASYTLSGVSGYQTAYRFVINRFGTTGYASVTVEPYMNGWVAGQSGTFAITPDSLAWSSKIASGPGSQGQPVPLSQFGTIWPDNQFISQGFHLGSANPPTTFSTVAAVTGCLTASFIPDKPVALSGVDKTDTTPVCHDPKDGKATYTHTETPWTQEYIWDTTTASWVLGEQVFGEATVTKVTVDSEACAAPTPPPCLDLNTASRDDLVAAWGIGPDYADQIIALRPLGSIDDLLKVNGIADVRLAKIKAHNDICAIVAPTPTPTPTVTPTTPAPTPTSTPTTVVALAETGSGNAGGLLALAGGLLVMGGGLVAVRTYRRRASVR